MPYLPSIALLLVVVHVACAQDDIRSLLDRQPCQTWFPLGYDDQALDTLPYLALCSPSSDRTQVISESQIIIGRSSYGFVLLYFY